jgi:diguanylate cyclase (GGDEF)-like protein
LTFRLDFAAALTYDLFDAMRGAAALTTEYLVGFSENHAAQGRRIAMARWVGVLLAVVEAFSATPSLIGSPVVPGAIAALIAAYNIPATLAGRRRFPGSDRIVVLACAADVLLCSVWVFLGSNDPKDSSLIIYLPVLVECAVLARWRGVVPACAAAVVSITASFIVGALTFHHAAGIGDLCFRVFAAVLITVFAGGFASEHHRQALQLAQRVRESSDRRHRAHEITLLEETAKVLASSRTLDGVYQAVARSAALIATAPGTTELQATILLREGNDLVAVGEHAVDPQVGVRHALEPDTLMWEVMEQRVQRCGATHSVAVSARNGRSSGRVQLRQSVLTPMVAEGAAIGILAVWSPDAVEFTAEQLRLCTAMAQLAELGILNARQHRALQDNAATDPLTGSRNRRAFEAGLDALPRVPFVVMAIDVDNLKPINDEYGHEAGDLVLRTAAQVITEIARSGDIIARVGGDEFAVVLLALAPAEAMAVGERMRAAMHGASIPRGRVRISVGIAIGEAGGDAHEVWREADAALLQAKREGGDRVAHAPGSLTHIFEPSRLTVTIEAVIADRAVDIHFQPIVSLETGDITAYEALARPNGWTGESVEPIFRAAHHLGLARDLDWACRRAAVASLWKLPADALMFVNVTATALLDPVHDVDQMLLLLTTIGAEPGRLVLELTERETIGDLGRLRHVLAAYREHGFQIALDDVGEGHSTLEVLAAAVPEYIKIAPSLAIGESRGARAAIAAAVAFASTTGTAVIAEGVESGEMAAQLRDLGVRYGQGYWLARPLATIEDIAVRRVPVPPLHHIERTGRAIQRRTA